MHGPRLRRYEYLSLQPVTRRFCDVSIPPHAIRRATAPCRSAALSSDRIEPDENAWTRRLVIFLRIMAVVSVAKGLYHWAQVTGFVGGEEEAFENQSMAWQTATVYFAVIELVAAVGLWLATPWGAVVWLTTVVSMAVIELMFPGIYGGSLTGGRARGRDACGLSRTGLDGRPRTACRSRPPQCWPDAVASAATPRRIAGCHGRQDGGLRARNEKTGRRWF